MSFNPKDFMCTPECTWSVTEDGFICMMFKNGAIEKLPLRVGDCSPWAPTLAWYEDYVDGKIILSVPLWRALGYSDQQTFREDCRSERSTGWVGRLVRDTLVERWHHLAGSL